MERNPELYNNGAGPKITYYDRSGRHGKIYIAEVEFHPTDKFVISHSSPEKLSELLIQILPTACYTRTLFIPV